MFRRVVFVVLALFVSSAALAQEQLSGVVRDGGGAVVAGATIEVRQASSNFDILVAFVSALGVSVSAQQPAPKTGILLLAHGGQPQWNQRVEGVVKRVDAAMPAEVAFGMATRANLQSAIDKLTARGVTEIVAVPLFVSSHSSVITSTEFLLGLRQDAPADLAKFAKMDHRAHGPAADSHASHADPSSPVTTTARVRMTPAFNRHDIIGAIVADRATAISRTPSAEAVIIVAHGPVPEDDNQKWLADMAVLAQKVKASAPYASVDYMTVRDDAGPAIRDAATAELRGKVSAQAVQGRRVLIVPHLMSFGGIEQGLRKRLDGLDYTMTAQGLMPDDRIVDWVLASAR
jgi:sirohydrochlorin ferrochelatase